MKWAEYCQAFYNYMPVGDPTILNCPQILDEKYCIYSVVRDGGNGQNTLKTGKSTGVDNIPAKLVYNQLEKQ